MQRKKDEQYLYHKQFSSSKNQLFTIKYTKLQHRNLQIQLQGQEGDAYQYKQNFSDHHLSQRNKQFEQQQQIQEDEYFSTANHQQQILVKQTKLHRISHELYPYRFRFLFYGNFSQETKKQFNKINPSRSVISIQNTNQSIIQIIESVQWKWEGIYLISDTLFCSQQQDYILQRCKIIFYCTENQLLENKQKVYIFKDQSDLVRSGQQLAKYLSQVDLTSKKFPNFSSVNQNTSQLHISRCNLYWMLLRQKDSQYKHLFLQFLQHQQKYKVFEQKQLTYEQLRDQIISGKFEKQFTCLKLYSKQSFFYEIINRSLRSLRYSQIIPYFKYPVYQLFKQIGQICNKQVNQLIYNQPKTLYRGCYLTDQQLQYLEEREGQFIQLQGFLSTTQNKQVALGFGSHLIIIHTPKIQPYHLQKQMSGVLASIENYSIHSSQKQIIFSPLHYFKIGRYLNIKHYNRLQIHLYLVFPIQIQKKTNLNKHQQDLIRKNNYTRNCRQRIIDQGSLFYHLGLFERQYQYSLANFNRKQKFYRKNQQIQKLVNVISQNICNEQTYQNKTIKIILQLILSTFDAPQRSLKELISLIAIQELMQVNFQTSFISSLCNYLQEVMNKQCILFLRQWQLYLFNQFQQSDVENIKYRKLIDDKISLCYKSFQQIKSLEKVINSQFQTLKQSSKSTKAQLRQIIQLQGIYGQNNKYIKQKIIYLLKGFNDYNLECKNQFNQYFWIIESWLSNGLYRPYGAQFWMTIAKQKFDNFKLIQEDLINFSEKLFNSKQISSIYKLILLRTISEQYQSRNMLEKFQTISKKVISQIEYKTEIKEPIQYLFNYFYPQRLNTLVASIYLKAQKYSKAVSMLRQITTQKADLETKLMYLYIRSTAQINCYNWLQAALIQLKLYQTLKQTLGSESKYTIKARIQLIQNNSDDEYFYRDQILKILPAFQQKKYCQQMLILIYQSLSIIYSLQSKLQETFNYLNKAQQVSNSLVNKNDYLKIKYSSLVSYFENFIKKSKPVYDIEQWLGEIIQSNTNIRDNQEQFLIKLLFDLNEFSNLWHKLDNSIFFSKYLLKVTKKYPQKHMYQQKALYILIEASSILKQSKDAFEYKKSLYNLLKLSKGITHPETIKLYTNICIDAYSTLNNIQRIQILRQYQTSQQVSQFNHLQGAVSLMNTAFLWQKVGNLYKGLKYYNKAFQTLNNSYQYVQMFICLSKKSLVVSSQVFSEQIKSKTFLNRYKSPIQQDLKVAINIWKHFIKCIKHLGDRIIEYLNKLNKNRKDIHKNKDIYLFCYQFQKLQKYYSNLKIAKKPISQYYLRIISPYCKQIIKNIVKNTSLRTKFMLKSQNATSQTNFRLLKQVNRQKISKLKAIKYQRLKNKIKKKLSKQQLLLNGNK